MNHMLFCSFFSIKLIFIGRTYQSKALRKFGFTKLCDYSFRGSVHNRHEKNLINHPKIKGSHLKLNRNSLCNFIVASAVTFRNLYTHHLFCTTVVVNISCTELVSSINFFRVLLFHTYVYDVHKLNHMLNQEKEHMRYNVLGTN